MHRTLAKETLDLTGEKVLLQGWVDSIRDHGKVTFIDLRDRSGIVQGVGADLPKVSVESVVGITGGVAKRAEDLVNPNLETGTVKEKIQKMEIISRAAEVPIPVGDAGLDIDEGIRLKYRYLDLRRPRMAKNLRTRSKVTSFMRDWLTKKDFVEIETPILTKTTPEGARDFVVPSRLQLGKFYALPQSPQQYKQLLMVAGLEKYFQVAKCLRDEDPRADRQAEHTQLDIEMSFATQEEILDLVERLYVALVEKLFPEKK